MAKITIHIDLENEDQNRKVATLLSIPFENDNPQTLIESIPFYDEMKDEHGLRALEGEFIPGLGNDPEHEVYLKFKS